MSKLSTDEQVHAEVIAASFVEKYSSQMKLKLSSDAIPAPFQHSDEDSARQWYNERCDDIAGIEVRSLKDLIVKKDKGQIDEGTYISAKVAVRERVTEAREQASAEYKKLLEGI